MTTWSGTGARASPASSLLTNGRGPTTARRALHEMYMQLYFNLAGVLDTFTIAVVRA